MLSRILSGSFSGETNRSRIESAKFQIENMVYNIWQLVDRVIHLVESAAQEKGLELIVDFTANIGRHYHGAPRQITQVLLILLNNAIQFTDTGTIWLRVSRPTPGILRFEIEDTGVGMTPGLQQRLFQSGSLAGGSTTCGFANSGHGLAFARQLVELMGGGIEVTSEPGWGSCFSFEIEAVASPKLAS